MDYLAKARTVIALEVSEMQRLSERIGGPFIATVDLLRSVIGSGRKIVLCGVGKSGNIAAKIAATLNSTGAPAVILHAQDALHGDLGMVAADDAVIALSYSGETDELLNILPHLKRQQCPLVAMTGNPHSTLAAAADVVLDVNVQREACPLNLAPTSSSTVMLVLGDALAMVLLEARGFKPEDFAMLHPGGTLGRALLTLVSDIMRTGDRLPLVPPDATVREAVRTMGRCRSGCVILKNSDTTLAGIFTQGDFARAFESNPNLAGEPVAHFMTPHPITIQADKLAAELLNLLEHHPVDELVVLNSAGQPVGLVDTQDLSRHRIL